ncbi:RNA-binding protein [uncultured Thiodictyon sp.]|uniref:RNA recognition motif domain-containing protein n=1 Tax=uncultured Thiodictyon sp. TaxID=1846217 RepID=UPI0025E83BCE|nr:RNA-binding protein [uncultured Thiodictyon sp.]
MGGKTGSVVLFLRNLPPNTSRKDLREFVQGALREAGVRTLPFVSVCANASIMRIADLAAGTTEYHGLIEVRPARLAMLAIRVLNGRALHGCPIEVRRYRQRSPWGEHRQRQQEASGSATVVARPLVERRREHLKIDLVKATPTVPALIETGPDLRAFTGVDLEPALGCDQN